MTNNPFDYVNSITYSKKNIIEESENPELEEKEYNTFIVNKQLSYFIDTISYAQDMNIIYELDKKLQYDYLFYSIRKKKRFSKWGKIETSADLAFLMEYYKYNKEKAKSALSILSQDQIDELRKRSEQGGVLK